MRAQDEFILGQESTVSYCHEIGRAVFPKEKIQYTQVKTHIPSFHLRSNTKMWKFDFLTSAGGSFYDEVNMRTVVLVCVCLCVWVLVF